MKYRAACLTVFLLLILLCFPDAGQAHRVNVFAYVDGDMIRVEGSFSKSQKVRSGKVLVTDLQTGATLLEGVTDAQGVFSFLPPTDFLRTGHGMNIRLLAGEGHQDDWQVLAEELRTLPQFTPGPDKQDEPDTPDKKEELSLPQPGRQADMLKEHSGLPPARTPAIGSAPINSTLSPEELEALIGRVMDAKLAPVRQALVRHEESGPDLRDIVGGIGWIIGLLGLATYMKYRR